MSEPRIRLGLKHAKVLMDFLRGLGFTTPARIRARAALEQAVAKHTFCRASTPVARHSGKAAETPAFPKPSALEREGKRHEKRGKKARRTMEVYDAVRLRAGGQCECGCGRQFNSGPMFVSSPEMDHFWGRAREESLETCWLLRAHCHREKTDNSPSRYEWISRFHSHCLRYGYAEQAARCRREVDAKADIRRAAEVSRG